MAYKPYNRYRRQRTYWWTINRVHHNRHGLARGRRKRQNREHDELEGPTSFCGSRCCLHDVGVLVYKYTSLTDPRRAQCMRSIPGHHHREINKYLDTVFHLSSTSSSHLRLSSTPSHPLRYPLSHVILVSIPHHHNVYSLYSAAVGRQGPGQGLRWPRP